jgi:hypothetical protein
VSGLVRGEGAGAQIGEELAGIWALGVWEAMEAYRAGMTSATAAQSSGGGEAGYHLRAVALESVISERMRVNALISAHWALLAGARLGEVSEAMGCSCHVLAGAWRSWAARQVWLRAELPGVGLGAGEYEQVAAVLAGGCRGPVAKDCPGCVSRDCRDGVGPGDRVGT